MAAHYVGLDKGGQDTDISTGTSDLSKDVQIVVDDTNGLTHYEVVTALETMLENIKQNRAKVV